MSLMRLRMSLSHSDMLFQVMVQTISSAHLLKDLIAVKLLFLLFKGAVVVGAVAPAAGHGFAVAVVAPAVIWVRLATEALRC